MSLPESCSLGLCRSNLYHEQMKEVVFQVSEDDSPKTIPSPFCLSLFRFVETWPFWHPHQVLT